MEHIKDFGLGLLVVLGAAILVYIGYAFFVPVALTVCTLLGLFSIYMLGKSLRGRVERPGEIEIRRVRPGHIK